MLEVNNLSIEFGGVRALDAVSFKSARGKILSVIGPNGAGKTTLFNLISGVYRPKAGTVMLGGDDVTGLAPHELARRGLSRTFQNLQIFFQMTAVENVMVGHHVHERRSVMAHLLGLPSVSRQNTATRERAMILLEHIGLGMYADQPAGSMPYGALKRLEIARALAVDPSVLLLDEPAAGCNPRETEEIDEIIQYIAGTGVSVILVEHDIRLVMKISDRIVVLNYGRKLSEGCAVEVQSDPAVIEAYLGTEQTQGELSAVGA
jgi:branched-chain amino acid transport system ATP-binding protein